MDADPAVTVVRAISAPILFGHGHLIPKALKDVVFRLDAGQQVQQEAEDVSREDEGDDPLQHRGHVPAGLVSRDPERDRQRHLDQDEGQLEPERGPQNAVVAVVDPEPLVLGTDEHRAEHEPGNEQDEEAVVHARVSVGVEHRQQDQARRPGDREDDADHAQDLLRHAGVASQAPRVPEVALRHEGQVEEEGRDDAAGDKQRFKPERAHVRDVGDRLARLHGWVVRLRRHEPPDEHG